MRMTLSRSFALPRCPCGLPRRFLRLELLYRRLHLFAVVGHRIIGVYVKPALSVALFREPLLLAFQDSLVLVRSPARAEYVLVERCELQILALLFKLLDLLEKRVLDHRADVVVRIIVL